ncbi:uncharacterized protein TRIVIDRAFT_52484 [Trichoderma virens Gv29-8]|uniref:PhoD-like phosphatase domain-containing protein n=1 Tax=Hypocrea virens (strain Gv29-8 / FGSC 10586) TaxID=413071 RepID=G9MG72_HYPVG|nr:uncharacterized protein TRIVIDRAFT_52484 [Trichoderma virens Gv29-8]EHK26522.1 hypothetical protein TRIVIDRAFT_52484 [Trichoderma virens Gv29-8]UKZ46702.1 hypothetical protein TrVGV298_000909 [Trichoderma virens]
MASQYDNELGDIDAQNPYASSSKWRHQESTKYARHEAQQLQARDATTTGTTDDLAEYLNSTRIEPQGDGHSSRNHQPIHLAAHNGEETAVGQHDEESDGKEIVCGPLLNYRRMEHGYWFGSVLIVTKGGGKDVLYQPSLVLRRAGGQGEAFQSQGERLYSDKRNTFWAFGISVPLEPNETKYEYEVPGLRFSSSHKPRINSFFIPAINESMRIMFYSCNGFSVGTDEEAWSGPALWNDVMRKHAATPIHVMVGGGDQIYNDGIRVHGPLRTWTDISNPKKRQEYPFPEKLRAECDDYYLQNYLRWYNTPPFSTANGQIAQINIWDDHDIIDGFGSYVDKFMQCDVFRGIGGTAHKYYMLFQHHLPPPPSTYTSDFADNDTDGTQGIDPNQLIDTYVAPGKTEPQYIVGNKPGPYVAEHSYNIYTRLGARIALLGIDARTERTRHQVNYPETYDLIFQRARDELSAAARSGQPIRHLILLLGIPIAYPRLTWLENILRSPLIGPVKLLNRRFGVGGGFFNHFDGSVDLLDDLDDHYTAKTHKVERAQLIVELQKLSAEFSVRTTILGGDVHLAALGRFYSNPKLKVPVEEDSRYMVNVVSSAIVNKPPPQAVANLLARRNKIHHLNSKTDETLLDLFDKDPGNFTKTASHNNCTMPSRNFAILTENSPTNQTNGVVPEVNGESQSFEGVDGHSQLHKGEVGAGTQHKAASDDRHGRGHDGSLDIRISVEIDQHNPEGLTEGYGLTVPLLTYRPRTQASSRAVSTATSTPSQ